jgi:hypothetical protein
MALGRGWCSDATMTTTDPNVELLCQWIKTIAINLFRSDSQRILKSGGIIDEMDGREGMEEVRACHN